MPVQVMQKIGKQTRIQGHGAHGHGHGPAMLAMGLGHAPCLAYGHMRSPLKQMP